MQSQAELRHFANVGTEGSRLGFWCRDQGSTAFLPLVTTVIMAVGSKSQLATSGGDAMDDQDATSSRS